MSLVELTNNLQQASDVAEANPAQAIKLLEGIIYQQTGKDETTEELIKCKETAVNQLAKLFRDKGLVEQLIDLQKAILPLFVYFPKSKQAKITRQLYDLTMSVDATQQGPPAIYNGKLIELCKHIIEWCVKEERTFLRMRLETNLANLFFKIEKYSDAIEILQKVNYELKRKEDKQLLVESQLVEAKVYHAL